MYATKIGIGGRTVNFLLSAEELQRRAGADPSNWNNGKFVSSENGTQAMTCNRATAGAWEAFGVNE